MDRLDDRALASLSHTPWPPASSSPLPAHLPPFLPPCLPSAVVVDPIQSVKGKVVIDAFRCIRCRAAAAAAPPGACALWVPYCAAAQPASVSDRTELLAMEGS
jgi:hypothetical protein